MAGGQEFTNGVFSCAIRAGKSYNFELVVHPREYSIVYPRFKSIYTNAMKHSGGLKHFVRENAFALLVAAAWLVMVWSLVFAGQWWFSEPFSLAAWAGNWDGGWYTSIVESGYSMVLNGQSNVAFFPLLPALTWLTAKVTLLPTVWAGMLVSSVSFVAALVVLWHVARKFFTQSVAKWTLLLVAFNPFSLYFGMFYTESLFLLLAVSAFWFMYEKQWWLAAFFAGLTTATRSVGVAVSIAVIIGWIAERLQKPVVKPGWRTIQVARNDASAAKAVHRTKKTVTKKTRPSWSVWLVLTLAIISLSFSGIVIFAAYLWWQTGDPLAFSTVQRFWPGREGNNIVTELTYLWQHQDVNMEYLLTLMWYICTILGLVGVVLVAKMRQWLLALYGVIVLPLPLLFGTATAMNRYLLVAFPVFIAYAALLVKLPLWLRVLLLVVSVLGLGVITYLMIDPRHLFIG